MCRARHLTNPYTFLYVYPVNNLLPMNLRPLQFCLICSALLSLNSCSFLNKPYKTVYLYTEEGVLVSYQEDSIMTTGEPLLLNLKRAKEDQNIILRKDSLTKEIAVNPRLGASYWLNFMNCGIGYIVDLTTDSRFTYPRHIYSDEVLYR